MFSKSIKQIASLSVSTTGSRILGLVRDATFFSTFGNSLFSSAFIIAFTIPNLFRRLLGEGALSSAFVPVYSKEQLNDKKQGIKLLNQTLTRLGIYFGGTIILSILLIGIINRIWELPQSWSVAIPMIQLLLPYALLICLAAILTATLNCIGKFFIPSLSPILLNLCMIGALIVGGSLLKQTDHQIAYTLSIGVLLGGLLQLILPAIQMTKNGWRPQLDTSRSPALSRVKTLFITATGGAAIIQINVLITRLIAYQVSDDAVSQLYLASRLTELPLGVFAVAIYTVIFPLLSRHEAEQNTDGFAETSRNGTLMMLGITIPSTLGLSILAQPILGLLFEWGNYSHADVILTAPVLGVYAIGIPFYSLVAYFTRIFHAKQLMGLPVKISIGALLLNVTLSICLMIPFGVIGLAWANVTTAIVQTLALASCLLTRGFQFAPSKLISPGLKIFLASTLMGIFAWWTTHSLQLNTVHHSKPMLILLLSIVIGLSVLLYGIVCWILGLKKYLVH